MPEFFVGDRVRCNRNGMVGTVRAVSYEPNTINVQWEAEGVGYDGLPHHASEFTLVSRPNVVSERHLEECRVAHFDADGWCYDMDLIPRDGTVVLTYDPFMDEMETAWWDEEERVLVTPMSARGADVSPAFWRHLPSPPSGC